VTTDLPKLLTNRNFRLETNELFERIRTGRTVTFCKSKEPGWACDIKADGTINIEWNTGDSIEPAFVHEMLHIDLQLNGYQRFIGAQSEHPAIRSIGYALGSLDNELQHHKIYPKFLSMGLRGTEFYGRHSKYIVPITRKLMKEEGTVQNEYQFVGLWAPVCSVGGADQKEDMEELKKELLSKYPQYADFAKHLETALRDWRESAEVHPRVVLTSIFSAVPSKHPIGIAPQYSESLDDSWIILFAPEEAAEPQPTPKSDPEPQS
jgi:hypothetical protein